MNESPVLIHILNEQFSAIRAKNPSYSMRSFAKRLGLPPSTLSSLLNGHLPMSLKMAERILPRLALDSTRGQEIRNALKHPTSNPREKSDHYKPFTPLEMDHFHLVSDWYYFAIISISELDEFQSDPKWIAGRLGISAQTVIAALKRLERMGLLSKDDKGELKPTGKQFSATSDIVNLSLRKCNFQNLELARVALAENESKDTDFTAITMAIDPDKIPEAKKRITKFRRELCQFLESGSKKEVYKMFVSLFPLTKLKKDFK